MPVFNLFPIAMIRSGAFLVAVLWLLCLSACNQTNDTAKATASEPKSAPVPAAEAIEYKAMTDKSRMVWIGAKATGNHNGSIQLREGSLAVKDNKVTGGRFIFDMMTLRSDDIEMDEESNKKLIGHLLSPDFFDVAHHPTAEFEITKVEPLAETNAETDSLLKTRERVVQNNVSRPVAEPTHLVPGNLIIKGVPKSISFPARITLEGATVTTQANFLIDRTDWNLNYRAGKSFADKMIYDEVNVVLDVTANR